MHFPDHKRGWLKREDILVGLGASGLRCYDLLNMWRQACSIGRRAELPKSFTEAAEAAYRKHGQRNIARGPQPRTFFARVAMRADNTLRSAMLSADYRHDESEHSEAYTAVEIGLDWQLDHAEAKTDTQLTMIDSSKLPGGTITHYTNIVFQLGIHPARYLRAYLRYGRHVSERGKHRVVLEKISEQHEREILCQMESLERPLPRDAVLVRAVQQGEDYNVEARIAMLRPPRGSGRHWRLTRWF